MTESELPPYDTPKTLAEYMGIKVSELMRFIYEVYPEHTWPSNTGKTRWQFSGPEAYILHKYFNKGRDANQARLELNLPPAPKELLSEDEMYDLIAFIESEPPAIEVTLRKKVDVEATRAYLESCNLSRTFSVRDNILIVGN